jgi:hypothetical protein
MTILDNYKKSKLLTKLNYTICKLKGNCEETSAIDPSTGPVNTTNDLVTRTSGVTFETIYKNLASYPCDIDSSEKNYLKKTYYLENNKKIIVDVDGKTPNQVIVTITGDTGYTKPLIRTTIVTGSNIKTTYNV